MFRNITINCLGYLPLNFRLSKMCQKKERNKVRYSVKNSIIRVRILRSDIQRF